MDAAGFRSRGGVPTHEGHKKAVHMQEFDGIARAARIAASPISPLRRLNITQPYRGGTRPVKTPGGLADEVGAGGEKPFAGLA